MSRITSLATIALGAVLTASVITTGTASAAPSEGFYTPPAQLPSADGALVRTEPMKLTLALNGTGTRIMYKTTDEVGTPTAVSGVYIEPRKAWTGPGDRPLVSFSVGSQGVGDACAPSKTLETLVNFEGGKFMLGYEFLAVSKFLDDGVAVVVTDYIGLGTTNRNHTYMNRVDQAHAVLDAARAALDLPGTSVTDSSAIGLYGYSQGGGASGAAAELAPTYAPELNLKGAYVGAPPADLLAVLESADGTALTTVIAWALNSIFGYRPELAPQLDQLISEKGAAYLKTSNDQCVIDGIFAAAFQKTSAWTRSGQSASVEVLKYPELVAAVEAQRIGRLKPQIPVQVLTGTKDDVVDHDQARQLAKDWCAQGVNVTYKPVFQLLSSGGLVLNHLVPQLTQQGPTEDWVVDRLKGKPVSGNCAQLPRLR